MTLEQNDRNPVTDSSTLSVILFKHMFKLFLLFWCKQNHHEKGVNNESQK